MSGQQESSGNNISASIRQELRDYRENIQDLTPEGVQCNILQSVHDLGKALFASDTNAVPPIPNGTTYRLVAGRGAHSANIKRLTHRSRIQDRGIREITSDVITADNLHLIDDSISPLRRVVMTSHIVSVINWWGTREIVQSDSAAEVRGLLDGPIPTVTVSGGSESRPADIEIDERANAYAFFEEQTEDNEEISDVLVASAIALKAVEKLAEHFDKLKFSSRQITNFVNGVAIPAKDLYPLRIPIGKRPFYLLAKAQASFAPRQKPQKAV